MKLAAIVAAAEKLLSDIKSAVDASGPDGKKINATEWLQIAGDAAALVPLVIAVVATKSV